MDCQLGLTQAPDSQFRPSRNWTHYAQDLTVWYQHEYYIVNKWSTWLFSMADYSEYHAFVWFIDSKCWTSQRRYHKRITINQIIRKIKPGAYRLELSGRKGRAAISAQSCACADGSVKFSFSAASRHLPSISEPTVSEVACRAVNPLSASSTSSTWGSQSGSNCKKLWSWLPS